MRRRFQQILSEQRGSVLLFVFTSLVFLLVMGGFAMDFAFQAAAKNELQRSMDAAALAGAGKLGFDDTVFPTVRANAQSYATANQLRTGAITLALNSGNAANGNIVLGVWTGSGSTFTPSVDGSIVNAVRCQFQTSIPTAFLRLLGFNSLPIAASAVAVANPPALPGCGEPVLPIAVVPCAFYDAGTGAFNNSNGCGTGLTWISSSKSNCDMSPGQNGPGCNTAAWASLDGTNWTSHEHQEAITNAGLAEPACNVTAPAGSNTYTDNGMVQPTFRLLRDTFVAKRTATLSQDVKRADGTVVYPASAGGWEVGVMMIQSACPPGPITGQRQILNYSKFVVTQVYDQNDKCVIDPNPDPQAAAYCPTKDPSMRAVFGYFLCDQFGTVATLDPVPRSALAPKLRLVR